MVCKVELLRHGNYNTNDGDNLLETITGETDGIVKVKYDDASRSVRISGCENTGVTLMEHGEASNQILMTLPNGYWSGDGAPAHGKTGTFMVTRGSSFRYRIRTYTRRKNRERWYYKSYTTFTGTR